ncbi:MAG: hypothetical protein K9N49_02670, partial [Candidatus Marinimicrobia bacterium]|nr:hypothetical protein [Candidatus Neomarinimicrobiota bacterium]
MNTGSESKRHWMGHGLAAVLALALAPAAAAQERSDAFEAQPEMTLRYPLITAPRLTGSAPVIDGRIDKAEWAGAARSAPLVSGLPGLRTEEEAVYWIAYTEEA